MVGRSISKSLAYNVNFLDFSESLAYSVNRSFAGGKIMIDYYSEEELDGMLERIS